jgi:tripartite-type tricarboxylate transporter receptor subunit TctC
MQSMPVFMRVFAAVLLAAGVATHAQNFPERPIRIVTTEPAGGGDMAARLIAQHMATGLGRQGIVDNRGGGVVAIEIVAKAAPDGYTLLIYGGTLWIGPLLMNDVSWDANRDFTPIMATVRVPNLVVVHPSLPVRTVKELIALARARPGELNYSSGSSGASTHLAAELFKSLAGVNIARIPYKGAASAMPALAGGQVQVMFPTVAAAAPYVKAGRMRALAITTAEPSSLAPGLPTVSAAGVPGYESSSLFGAFAPAGTAAALVNLINREMARTLNLPDVKERLLNAGVEVVANSPAEFAAMMKADVAKWSKVIRQVGIQE